jgi:hypothetical protein
MFSRFWRRQFFSRAPGRQPPIHFLSGHDKPFLRLLYAFSDVSHLPGFKLDISL